MGRLPLGRVLASREIERVRTRERAARTHSPLSEPWSVLQEAGVVLSGRKFRGALVRSVSPDGRGRDD